LCGTEYEVVRNQCGVGGHRIKDRVQQVTGIELIRDDVRVVCATVGSYGPAWYSGPVRNENEKVIGIWWYKDDPYKGGLEARISARKSLPHPDWSEQIVGQILEGVINDAGGLVLVGGHLVRVPPREPVEAILAALPAQLAQRLRPLLAARPQGELPQLALRQRLTQAINQYAAQSRG
jgi:hypothetical protein